MVIQQLQVNNHDSQCIKETQTQQIHQFPKLQSGKARVLSSGKIVGDPGNWNVVKDRRTFDNKKAVVPPLMTNQFQALAMDDKVQALNSNKNYKSDENNKQEQDKDGQSAKESTKDWVSKVFDPSVQKESPTASSRSLTQNNTTTTLEIRPDQQQKCRLEQVKGDVHIEEKETLKEVEGVKADTEVSNQKQHTLINEHSKHQSVEIDSSNKQSITKASLIGEDRTTTQVVSREV